MKSTSSLYGFIAFLSVVILRFVVRPEKDIALLKPCLGKRNLEDFCKTNYSDKKMRGSPHKSPGNSTRECQQTSRNIIFCLLRLFGALFGNLNDKFGVDQHLIEHLT